jgi:hypothetical protein
MSTHDVRITIRHAGGNTVTGTLDQVLETHLIDGWRLDITDGRDLVHLGVLSFLQEATELGKQSGESAMQMRVLAIEQFGIDLAEFGYAIGEEPVELQAAMWRRSQRKSVL